MKTKSKALFLLLGLFVVTVFTGCNDREEPLFFEEGEKYVVLMHPTVGNVRTWDYLVSNEILPVDPGMNVLGVYHEKVSYNYDQTADFIEKEGLGNVRLKGIEEPLDSETLFSENEHTEIFRGIFDDAKGVIFFGGPDIPPSVYGREMNLLTSVGDLQRHYLELSFSFHLTGGYQDEDFAPFLEENPKMPVLGLCLGMQTLNVAGGGTLIQDIPTEVYGKFTIEEVVDMDHDMQHRNYYSFFPAEEDVTRRSFHRILIEEDTHMSAIRGEDTLPPYVLTSHHQAVDDLGKEFYITAWSMDEEIVEAIEHEKYPNVIGVQFHPESRSIFDGTEFKFIPGEDPEGTYMELYPGEKGENFHRNFWEYFGGLLER